MSAGYFARLVQRARGEATGIRPAMPALYAGRIGPGALEEIDQAEENPRGRVLSRPGQRLPTQAAQTHMQPAKPDPAPEAPAARREKAELAADETSTAARARADQPAPVEAPGRREEQGEPVQKAQPAPAARRAEHGAAEIAGAQPNAEAPAAQAGMMQPGPVRVEKLLLPEQARTVTVIQNGAAEQADPQPEREPAPATVHISIGRIEVRAVQPAAAAPTPAPRVDPHPAMSLDEYLRRLNEERR